jgi:beta-glucoside operon transcriptional antiterminator
MLLEIKKIFNNNSILVEHEQTEMVLVGRGIAFKKKVGDSVNKALIEKTFILKEPEARENFKLLLDHVPTAHIKICYNIIEYAKNSLKCDLSDYIYVTLTDHVSNAISLFSETIYNPNLLQWEIKRFYPKEFHVGEKALDFIEDETKLRLPDDEAGNIALHLINAQMGSADRGKQSFPEMMQKISDILDIIKYTYQIELDEQSINFERFVVHLRFFFQRLSLGKHTIESDDDFMLIQIQTKYPKANQCMLKIQKYLGISLDKEEQLYLMLHIQRVTA